MTRYRVSIDGTELEVEDVHAMDIEPEVIDQIYWNICHLERMDVDKAVMFMRDGRSLNVLRTA